MLLVSFYLFLVTYYLTSITYIIKYAYKIHIIEQERKMLSEKTIATVKATVPVLQRSGEMLTRHFYKRMFSYNPEVLPLFNPANQKSGTQQQALANAICTYAANIDNLGILGSVIELIAQKHASLRILPEHYPIVGENLLESIKEVLGDCAINDVIKAWREAYNFLANILINREEEIYKTQESVQGGWCDFKYFKVVKKERESDVITSFYLEPEDGSQPPLFKPGQYITVRIPSAFGYTTMRNYSLSDKPGQDYFRISVKREGDADTSKPEGYVSNILHKQIEVGHKIELAPPCGEFFLDVKEKFDRPLVLIAAGIGVTPILSMLISILDITSDHKIFFIHANLNENNHAFEDMISRLADKHPNLTTHYCYSDPAPEGVTRSTAYNVSEGFVNAKLIENIVGERNSDYYFCGPKPFMVNIYHILLSWGIPESQVHFEFFGPRQELKIGSQKNLS